MAYSPGNLSSSASSEQLLLQLQLMQQQTQQQAQAQPTYVLPSVNGAKKAQGTALAASIAGQTSSIAGRPVQTVPSGMSYSANMTPDQISQAASARVPTLTSSTSFPSQVYSATPSQTPTSTGVASYVMPNSSRRSRFAPSSTTPALATTSYIIPSSTAKAGPSPIQVAQNEIQMLTATLASVKESKEIFETALLQLNLNVKDPANIPDEVNHFVNDYNLSMKEKQTALKNLATAEKAAEENHKAALRIQKAYEELKASSVSANPQELEDVKAELAKEKIAHEVSKQEVRNYQQQVTELLPLKDTVKANDEEIARLNLFIQKVEKENRELVDSNIAFGKDNKELVDLNAELGNRLSIADQKVTELSVANQQLAQVNKEQEESLDEQDKILEQKVALIIHLATQAGYGVNENGEVFNADGSLLVAPPVVADPNGKQAE